MQVGQQQRVQVLEANVFVAGNNPLSSTWHVTHDAVAHKFGK
jgi:hypothetical protein